MTHAGAYLQTLTRIEPFSGALVAARRAEVTGTLVAVREDVPTVIHVDAGVPVFVERGKLSLTLGRLLLERKVLDEAQYEAVIRTMSRRRSGQRFGAVAVEQGFLTEADVERALGDQAREKIVECFRAAATKTGFASASALEAALPRRPVDVETLVLDGVRRFFDPERTERVIGQFREVFPVLVGGAELVGAELGLKPRERELLATLDGSQSLATVLRSTRLDELHAAQIVAALLLLVRLRLHDRRVESTAAVRARHVARVRVPLPPTRSQQEPAPVTVEANPEEVREVMTVADRLLRRLGMQRVASASTPPAVPAATARREAAKGELFFRRGKRALEQGQIRRAVEDLSRAAELCPDATEFSLYAAWAELQAHGGSGDLKRPRERVKQAAVAALSQDPNLAFAHHVYGTVVYAQGDEAGALKAFRAALRLEPDNLDAKRFVRVLSRRTR